MSAERTPPQEVNIPLGDDVSRMLYEASQLTHANRPGLVVEMHSSFFGFRGMPLSYLKDCDPDNLYMNMGFDGVGTKIEVSERLNDHEVVARDLFAMVCDDAVARGAEPIAIGSILDVRRLDDSEETRMAIRQLGRGYVEAARAAGVVVVNGELAELGERVGGYEGAFNYNWGAAVLWLAHKERMLTGEQIKPGHALVGIADPGFRSNGLTDVRHAFAEHYGEQWHNVVVQELGHLSLGRLVQTPSVIYTRLITGLTGGFDIRIKPKAEITGIAHITGGGQPSKLGRMLAPSGLGATIDTPLDPPKVMLHVQELRELTDEEAYSRWHMGPGMIVVTPEPEAVVAAAKARDMTAQVLGQVTDEPGIHIANRGADRSRQWLTF